MYITACNVALNRMYFLLSVCKYKPKVSPSMFVFMADHEIIAPDSKPGNLIKRFYLVMMYWK